jgi:hypothetical protein
MWEGVIQEVHDEVVDGTCVPLPDVVNGCGNGGIGDSREAIGIGNGIDASEEGDDDKGGAVRETVSSAADEDAGDEVDGEEFGEIEFGVGDQVDGNSDSKKQVMGEGVLEKVHG